MRCRKPDTSLSGAKLAFGCVMSELLDSSSAGTLPSFFPPFFFFSPLDLSAPISVLWCQTRPLTLQSIAETLFLLCLWQLVTCIHPILSPLPSPVSLFPIPFSFPCCVFYHKVKEQADDLHELAYASLTQLLIPYLSACSWLFPLVLFPCLFHLIPLSVSLSTLQGCLHVKVTQRNATNPAGKLLLIPPLKAL